MTAWQEVQLDWAIKTEQKQVTGVLFCDLSAAFDTLDCEGLCSKLELYEISTDDKTPEYRTWQGRDKS